MIVSSTLPVSAELTKEVAKQVSDAQTESEKSDSKKDDGKVSSGEALSNMPRISGELATDGINNIGKGNVVYGVTELFGAVANTATAGQFAKASNNLYVDDSDAATELRNKSAPLIEDLQDGNTDNDLPALAGITVNSTKYAATETKEVATDTVSKVTDMTVVGSAWNRVKMSWLGGHVIGAFKEATDSVEEYFKGNNHTSYKEKNMNYSDVVADIRYNAAKVYFGNRSEELPEEYAKLNRDVIEIDESSNSDDSYEPS